MTTEELYNEIVRQLTDFEHPDEVVDYDTTDWTNTFYSLLVMVQNHLAEEYGM